MMVVSRKSKPDAIADPTPWHQGDPDPCSRPGDTDPEGSGVHPVAAVIVTLENAVSD